MSNPFVSAGTVTADRLAFIVATRGASARLLSGGLFWLVSGLAGLGAAPEIWPRVYCYAGFSVLIVGWMAARAQGVTIPRTFRLYSHGSGGPE